MGRPERRSCLKDRGVFRRCALRLVQPTAEDPDDLADVGYVVGVRPLVEVARQRTDRLAVSPHPPEQQAPIAAVLRVRGFEDEEELDRVERGGPVAPAEAGGPETSQDAGQDLAPAGRPEHAVVEQDAVANGPSDQRLAVVRGQPVAAIGRVGQEAVGTPDDEVAGKADADKRQPDPPVDDHIEEAVCRIAVLGGGRAAIADLAVQHVVEAVDDLLDRIAVVEPDPDPLGETVDVVEDGCLVEIGPAVAGDDEGGRREIDLGLGAGDEPREAGARGDLVLIDPVVSLGHRPHSRRPSSPLVKALVMVYRGTMAEPEAPDPKKRPLRSSGGLGQTMGGILVGFDYQVFRAGKPPAELVEAAKPVRGLSGEGATVDVDAPELATATGDGESPVPGRGRRKPPRV